MSSVPGRPRRRSSYVPKAKVELSVVKFTRKRAVNAIATRAAHASTHGTRYTRSVHEPGRRSHRNRSGVGVLPEFCAATKYLASTSALDARTYRGGARRSADCERSLQSGCATKRTNLASGGRATPFSPSRNTVRRTRLVRASSRHAESSVVRDGRREAVASSIGPARSATTVRRFSG